MSAPRPLYPGFGSGGRGAFEGRFTARAFAAGGDARDAGDKLVLPPAAFKEMTRLKLPLPLVFRAHNDRAAAAAAVPDRNGPRPALPAQLAGVLEFSAPDGVALLPRWMLAVSATRRRGEGWPGALQRSHSAPSARPPPPQRAVATPAHRPRASRPGARAQALKLREGAQFRLTSLPASELPAGTFVRFTHDAPGLPAALEAAGGARAVLEAALRSYSALALGGRVTVHVGDVPYMLVVAEVSRRSARRCHGARREGWVGGPATAPYPLPAVRARHRPPVRTCSSSPRRKLACMAVWTWRQSSLLLAAAPAPPWPCPWMPLSQAATAARQWRRLVSQTARQRRRWQAGCARSECPQRPLESAAAAPSQAAAEAADC